MNKQEKLYLSKVSDIGCIICFNNGSPQKHAELHNCRGIGLGLGVRNSHFNAIPLCPDHHRGSIGYHGMGRKAFERKYEVTEQQLLEQVKGMLNEKTN